MRTRRRLAPAAAAAILLLATYAAGLGLPFFVAACDYTLIGEEFFAASAYLSGEPDQLGSLKGQDIGKLIVGAGILTGVTAATLANLTGSPAIQAFVDFLIKWFAARDVSRTPQRHA